RDFHVTGVQTCALPLSRSLAGSTCGGRRATALPAHAESASTKKMASSIFMDSASTRLISSDIPFTLSSVVAILGSVSLPQFHKDGQVVPMRRPREACDMSSVKRLPIRQHTLQ